MYLSRVEIDINNRRKIKDLTHIGAFHHWVESSFPNEIENGIRTRKLWRIDQLNGKEYLLIVSQTKPSIKHLESYGVEGTAQSKDYDVFLREIENGKRYRFRVVLNPVVAEMDKEGGSRGKTKPLPNSKHMQFLYDRSEKNGFRLNKDEFFVVSQGYTSFKKASMKEVKLSKVVYEGRLTVIDKEILKESLSKGIGKKKAYGFGMMTLIPED